MSESKLNPLRHLLTKKIILVLMMSCWGLMYVNDYSEWLMPNVSSFTGTDTLEVLNDIDEMSKRRIEILPFYAVSRKQTNCVSKQTRLGLCLPAAFN